MKKIAIIFKNSYILWSIAILSVFIPFILPNRYYQDIAVLTFLWAGMASAWNLYSGFCKRVCIGHAAFLGIGAYTSAILYSNFGVSPWMGMIVGAAISALAALIIGIPTLRLKGTFFVLSTIAFAKILEVIATNARGLTGGSLGLFRPFEPGLANMIFVDKIPSAILTWAYMMCILIVCAFFERSKIGYSLVAVGENQEAAENLGVDSTKTMLTAFVMSAVFTSFGGTIFAQYIGFMEPIPVMGLSNSVNFILFAIAGGMGTVFGPMIGAFILQPASLLLRGNLTISGLHGFVLGAVLILILLFRPDGILPQIYIIRGYIIKKLRSGKKGSGSGEVDNDAPGS